MTPTLHITVSSTHQLTWEIKMIKVTYIDHMGSDLSVVNAARVSFGKKSEALGTSSIVGEPMTPILNDPDKRLIKYLAKHKHMSPFGHAFASFHVKAPILALLI